MKTPECDKLKAVSGSSQDIGEFLDWLTGEKGLTVCNEHEHDEWCEGEDEIIMCGTQSKEYTPAMLNIEKLLAEYFEIDLNKVEKERRAILAELQKAQGGK